MLCLVLVATLLACFVAIYHYATGFLLPCESGLTSRRKQPDLVQCFPSPCTPSSSANWGFHVTNTRSSAVGNESTELGDVIRLMRIRRTDTILSSVGSRTDVDNWLSTLQEDGKWPENEVNYARGCEAIRANWPAQEHWRRILVMAGAWNYALEHSSQPNNTRKLLRAAISEAMDYWFNRDITNLACLDHGGTNQCPCTNISDTTFWNTNWYSNVILIPGLVSQVCLLMNDDLTATHLAKCSEMTTRSFDFFYHATRPGFLKGANIMDIGKIGIDAGILDSNFTLLRNALDEVHQEMTIHDNIKDDGIRTDGTFGQHLVLYNGNYGKDFINLVLDIEIVVVGTEFTARRESREAVEKLLDADQWMIICNVATKTLHWDLSVLGRFISFPVIDDQATGDIKLSLDRIKDLGKAWSSAIMDKFATSLSRNSSTANVGNFMGNRMFYANDYMVHRGRNYVSTLKMYSSRTTNTECLNSQNLFGFHLSDGTLYTYNQGDEYEDIAAVWDWNLIPGITVDYGATPLMCANASSTGIESFVGGVSDGSIGLAAMRFTNPLTKSLSWQKTWFFIEDDVHHVMVSRILSASDAQVFSVLDQRRHTGEVILDNVEAQTLENAQVNSSLWHGNVGYSFDQLGSGNKVLVRVEERSGNWSTIGTSNQPPTSAVVFTALIEHRNHSAVVSYTVFPGTTPETFERKRSQLRLRTIENSENISAIFDEQHNAIYVTFWDPSGGTVTCHSSSFAPITITASGNIALMYKLEAGNITVADPSQHLVVVSVVVILGSGNNPPKWGVEKMKIFQFALPSDGLAGSSVSQTFT